MIYGVVRGSRFWDYRATQKTWTWLLPVFQQVSHAWFFFHLYFS